DDVVELATRSGDGAGDTEVAGVAQRGDQAVGAAVQAGQEGEVAGGRVGLLRLALDHELERLRRRAPGVPGLVAPHEARAVLHEARRSGRRVLELQRLVVGEADVV